MMRRAPRLVFVGGLMAAVAVPAFSLSTADVAGAAQMYTVQPGDNLTTIAAHHGSTVSALESANVLPNPDLIFSGESLLVSGTGTPTGPAVAQSYTVVSGDTLGSIGAQFGTTIAALASANNIGDPNLILVGEVLTIPVAQTGSTAPSTTASAVAPPAVATAEGRGVPLQESQVAAPQVTSAAPSSSSGVWACIAAHESGGNPTENTGNGYFGMYQFSPSSWVAAGGTGMPQNASAAEQTAIAMNLVAIQGWGAWPNTSRMCGA